MRISSTDPPPLRGEEHFCSRSIYCYSDLSGLLERKSFDGRQEVFLFGSHMWIESEDREGVSLETRSVRINFNKLLYGQNAHYCKLLLVMSGGSRYCCPFEIPDNGDQRVSHRRHLNGFSRKSSY